MCREQSTHMDERPSLSSGMWRPSHKSVSPGTPGYAAANNNPRSQGIKTKVYFLLTLDVHCSLPGAPANHGDPESQVIEQKSPPTVVKAQPQEQSEL